MSDSSGGRRPPRSGGNGRPSSGPKSAGGARRTGGKPIGEKRYGKPASTAGNGGKRYGKPASAAGTGNGEKRYGKPAAPAGDGGKRFGKPAAPASNRSKSYSRPTAGDGVKRYGKPAASYGSGEKRFGKPASAAGTGNSEKRYSKPAAPAGNSEKRYGRPAVSSGNHSKPFGRPAAGNRPKPFGRPAPAGGTDRRFAKPAFRARPAKPAVPVERTGLAPNARRVALDTLRDVHERGAYASLALQDRLSRAGLAPVDRRLTTSIVYSTLENQLRIDFALDRLMDHPTQEPAQRDILRLSACQILFHDRVPDSAAVNEGVQLARAIGMEGAAGFLNAVLRNLVRGKDDIPWPKREDDLREYLHIMGSMPPWLVDRLIDAYGEETAEAIIMHRGETHEMVARPNMLQLTDNAFETLLDGKAWRWRRGIAPHAYLLGGVSELALDNDFRSGRFSIQGQSSILAAEAVQAKPGMRVLDACAAPGGKACYMAEAMQGTGRVYAWELHEKRALLLESAKRRLRLDNLRITVRDAAEPKPDFEGTMDAVLLDAPCTGLGVLNEKPDLKYRLKPEDLPAIGETQTRLLNALCRYVKPGGTLVYSTCTILPEENALRVRAFLAEHPEFTLQPLPTSYPEAFRSLQTPDGLQLLAHRDGVEGFFIARMRRAGA